LWHVDDALTSAWMTAFYQELRAGASKAAAMRAAQRALLALDGEAHPAYWGAFQLVGDPRPLSTSAGDGGAKE